MVEDARQRTITYINAYDIPANITKDNGTTAAYIINQFEKPPFAPLTRIIFSPKNVDGIRTVHTPTSEALHDWKKEIYAYKETVPVTLDAFTKQGITADKLRWKMEQDLRNTVELYPMLGATGYGSAVRMLPRMIPVERNLGMLKVSSVKYDLEYKRSDDNYTSDVALSYGAGWEYDGLRLAGGAEGTWTLTAGGSTVTQSVTINMGSVTLALTVFVGDAYTSSGTNLGLSTTLYKKIRFRYKTTSNSTAKIILEFSDAATQTVLAETAAAIWTTTTVSLTAAKTLDHIHLYCCDGTGTVQYDWIEIYAADFTFPNVTDIRFVPSSRNITLGIPSGMVLGHQNLGADPASIEIDCDLDMETATYDWTRAGDSDKGEVFLDILHNQSVDAPWQWLTWGNKGMQFVIDDVRFDEMRGTCTVSGHEYSDSNKATESYSERWNL